MTCNNKPFESLQDASEAAATINAIRAHDQNRREHRRRLIQSYPRPKLESVHLQDAKLIPTRYDLLDILPKNAIACEIGVANGDFTAEILKRCHPQKIHLIDAWEAERYRSDYQVVCDRFAESIRNGLISINVGYSTQCLVDFPDNYIDWVYLDTVHDYRTTAQELSLCLTKVKFGGIIAGHDYTAGNLVTPVCYGVVHAVQEFCVRHRWKFLYLTFESHCYVSYALKAIDVDSV